MDSSTSPGESDHCQEPRFRYTRARRGTLGFKPLVKLDGVTGWMLGALESSIDKF